MELKKSIFLPTQLTEFMECIGCCTVSFYGVCSIGHRICAGIPVQIIVF